MAGIRGCSANNNRIRGSTASTNDPFRGRLYLGGASLANAFATVFLEIPNRRAIAAFENPSARYRRRISAQSPT